MIECPRCHGGDELCGLCGGAPGLELAGTPLDEVDDMTWMVLSLADYAAKGSLPWPGGVMDQSESLADAIGLVWIEDEKAKAAVMKAAGRRT